MPSLIPGRLALLDLETTGADPRRDRITEIGLIVLDDGCVVEEYATLVNPERSIPSGIEALTGISQAMVDQAPSFRDIALDLAARLGGRVLVAHNARFDYAFLRTAFREAGLPYRSDILCSVRLSRRLFPQHARHNLDSLIERFQLTCEARHRALPDARLVHQFLNALARQVSESALQAAMRETIDALRAPAGVDPDLLDDVPESPGVYLLSDAGGLPIYAGKAANLRSQILAHFAEGTRHASAQRAAIQAGRLRWTATAGELGAALEHRQRVERLAPLHNRSRAAREAWVLRWALHEPSSAPEPIEIDAVRTDEASELFGPFRSRSDALKALRGLAHEHGLCDSLLGLAPPDTRCAARPAAPCRGACSGAEPVALHRLRAMQALARLRLPQWPFSSVIGLIEEDREGTRSDVLVLNAWRYLGRASNSDELSQLASHGDRLPPFDIDTFRLVQRALSQTSNLRIVDLSSRLSRIH